MKNLATLRKEHGLSQQKLASDIGLARNTICQYESGNRVPDVSTLVLLADYFGVSTDYLLGREEKKSVIEGPTSASTTSSIPAVFGEIPDLLSEERFVNTAKIYHELPDELRERAYMLIYGIAVGLGLNVEKIIG